MGNIRIPNEKVFARTFKKQLEELDSKIKQSSGIKKIFCELRFARHKNIYINHINNSENLKDNPEFAELYNKVNNVQKKSEN